MASLYQPTSMENLPSMAMTPMCTTSSMVLPTKELLLFEQRNWSGQGTSPFIETLPFVDTGLLVDNCCQHMRSVFGRVLGILGRMWGEDAEKPPASIHEAPCCGPQLAFMTLFLLIGQNSKKTNEQTKKERNKPSNRQTDKQRRNKRSKEKQVNE